jgi:predicted ribonuclease YlaK
MARPLIAYSCTSVHGGQAVPFRSTSPLPGRGLRSRTRHSCRTFTRPGHVYASSGRGDGPRDMRYIGRAVALHGVVPVGSGVGFGGIVQQYRERSARKRGPEAAEDVASASANGEQGMHRTPPILLGRRLYVLDTNVILHDSSCLWRFGHHDICLPITVLEELDKFKRGNEEIHFHAREFLRMLDEMTILHSRAARNDQPAAESKDCASAHLRGSKFSARDGSGTGDWNLTAASPSSRDWLVQGVPLNKENAEHGSVRISLHCRDARMERLFFYDSPDMRILASVHALAVAESAEPPTWTPPPEEGELTDSVYGSVLQTNHAGQRLLYERVVLVTKDVNLRMKARALGLHAEDYEQDRVESISKLYLGQRLIENVPNELIEALVGRAEGLTAAEFTSLMRSHASACCAEKSTNDVGFVPSETARSAIHWLGQQIMHKRSLANPAASKENDVAPDGTCAPQAASAAAPAATAEDSFAMKPLPNEHFILRNASSSVLATFALSKDCGDFTFQRVDRVSAYGIMPRNAEQTFALRVLLDPSIPLVTICGVAGTGKTLLCLAAALEMTSRGFYEQIFVSRPIVPLGNRDVGFLPGDLDEKLAPYMQPLYDNLGVIKAAHLHTKDNGKVVPTARSREIDDMMASERIKIAALAYIRGRSLSRTFLIVDESQNLTPHEVKTIITRAGEGTKVVLCGDLHQIDNPYVDGHSNGLSYLIERMKGQSLYAHVTLEKGERSELSKLASELL